MEAQINEKQFSLNDIFVTVRNAFVAHLSSNTISVTCDGDKKQLPLNVFIASNIAHYLVNRVGLKEEDVKAAMIAAGYEEQYYLTCKAFSTYLVRGGSRKTRRASKKAGFDSPQLWE